MSPPPVGVAQLWIVRRHERGNPVKKCSYCGAEYSDDVVVCPIDQTSLGSSQPTSELSPQSNPKKNYISGFLVIVVLVLFFFHMHPDVYFAILSLIVGILIFVTGIGKGIPMRNDKMLTGNSAKAIGIIGLVLGIALCFIFVWMQHFVSHILNSR